MQTVEFATLPNVPSDVLFDLAASHPRLMQMAKRKFPAIGKALGGIAKAFPVAPSCNVFASGDRKWVRPLGHFRAFYHSSRALVGDAPIEQIAALTHHDGVLAFKGTEPCVADSDVVLERMRRISGPREVHAWAEHYALTEAKVPIGTSLREALREATVAASVQQRHVRVYGELATLPLPIAVIKLSAAATAAHSLRVERVISKHAMDNIRPVLADGLAAYCYAYPSLPLRAHHTQPPQPVFKHRHAAGDPFAVVEGWARVFVRLLCLGYFPCSLSNLGQEGAGTGLGQMCRPNNAIIDGGFVDVDSITSFAEVDALDDRPLFDMTLELSLDELTKTVRRFLLGGEERPSLGVWAAPVAQLDEWLMTRLRVLAKSEQRKQARLDPRVAHRLFPNVKSLTRALLP